MWKEDEESDEEQLEEEGARAVAADPDGGAAAAASMAAALRLLDQWDELAVVRQPHFFFPLSFQHVRISANIRL